MIRLMTLQNDNIDYKHNLKPGVKNKSAVQILNLCIVYMFATQH